MQKKAIISLSLVVILGLFLGGCGANRLDNEGQLNRRIGEYHAVLLRITEQEKMDDNTYVKHLLEYLDPIEQEAPYRAIFLQNQWFRQNRDAQSHNQKIAIAVDKVVVSDDGENALVNVAVTQGPNRVTLIEKWVKVSNKWRRTVEYPY
ncbi:MAG: hypothetical protein P4N59_12550 [Negativicutes bacterium]|nr:hypothetical protein [Negativicutes bacterium]